MLLLEMLEKDKNDQETMGSLVLEVVLVDPLISPQPAWSLYSPRHKIFPICPRLCCLSEFRSQHLALHIYMTPCSGTPTPRQQLDKQSDPSKFAPISSSLAGCNEMCLDCSEKSCPAWEIGPRRHLVGPHGNTHLHKKWSVLLPIPDRFHAPNFQD